MTTIDKGVAVGPTCEHMRSPQPPALRPMVARYLPVYQKCLKELGPGMVRGVLKSKSGKYKGYRRWPALNGKDCHQLLDVLGLREVGDGD